MKCPACNEEMLNCEASYWECRTKNCTLEAHSFHVLDLDKMRDIASAAHAAGFAEAREMAEQIFSEKPNESYYSGEVADILRALQPKEER